MFSLEKRGFEDDFGDSQDDSPGGKAAHKTTQHLQAWTCMDRQESQSNWPKMRKSPGKPEFFSGEDRIRTGGKTPKESTISTRGGDESGALANNPQLASIFEAWNELPEAVKAGILAMTRAACQ